MNAENRPMGTGTALVLPSDARELRDLAQFIATSRLIPAPFQKSPADCWMVLDFCREKGLNFFATIGHCSIIRNNLFFDGQLCGALLNISRFLANPLNHEFEYDSNGNATAVTTSARLNGEPAPRVVRVELENVKTKNEVWTTQPEQQLAYSGNRIWGRRHLPEVLLGMTFIGEPPPDIDVGEPKNSPVIEAKPPQIKPARNDTAATGPIVRINDEALARPVADAAERETDEIEPFILARRGNDADDWSAWAQALLAYVRTAPDIATAIEWRDRNNDTLGDLERLDKVRHARLLNMIEHNFEIRRKQDAEAE